MPHLIAFFAPLGQLVPLVATVLDTIDPAIPDDIPGEQTVVDVLGALKWFGLAGCVASFFIGGAVWGVSYVNGTSPALTGRGRRFAAGGAAGALIIGVGPTVVDRLTTISTVAPHHLVPGVLTGLGLG